MQNQTRSTQHVALSALTTTLLRSLSDSVNKCNKFLTRIQLPKLTESNASSLDAPITLEEIKGTIQQMRKGRSPGRDGIPPKFYAIFRDDLGVVLFNMFKYAIEKGTFSRDVNVAIISLLLKKEKDERLEDNHTSKL